MSSGLSSAAQDRKSRLAHLKGLKSKQSTSTPIDSQEADEPNKDLKRKKSSGGDSDDEPDLNSDVTTEPQATSHLSGRNYDATTKGPKLGFENAPGADQKTLEKRAAELAATAQAEATARDADDKPLDLTRLQPKKPNWDLKRDLDKKLDVLNVRTHNAIARLFRERMETAKQQKAATGATSGDSDETIIKGDGEGVPEEIGIDGDELIEAAKEREREDAEEATREQQRDQDLLSSAA